MNDCKFLGRLTRDPEVFTTGDTQIVNFSLAVPKRTKKDHPEADFFDFKAFNKTGEIIAEYFSRGDRILVSCRAQQRGFEDKEGNHRTVIEFVVNDFDFIESRGNKSENSANNNNSYEDDDDELPI